MQAKRELRTGWFRKVTSVIRMLYDIDVTTSFQYCLNEQDCDAKYCLL